MSSRFDMSDRSWKSGDRNSGTDLLADSSDRKITRNQKRRHDEINHIQKVRISYQYFYEVMNVYILITITVMVLIVDICRNGSHDGSFGEGTRSNNKSQVHR